MIKNEDAYYTGYYRNVRALGAIPALVFDTIAGLLRATDGIGEISNSTLCEFLGCTKPTLLNAVDKLITGGYIERSNGDGRGNKTVYMITKKGKENIPFMTEKGSKNFTERVKNFNEKGKETLHINKVLNKELKNGNDTTPQNFETMEDFILFWKLYPGDPNWSNEKENCERVWYSMQQSWRDNLVQQLQNGKRWRTRENDNPYWYLKNYNGETVSMELAFIRPGTKTFARFISDHEGKDTICIFRFEGSLAYCLESEKERMLDAGAEFLRNFGE